MELFCWGYASIYLIRYILGDHTSAVYVNYIDAIDLALHYGEITRRTYE
jgi:hypothetical protein